MQSVVLVGWSDSRQLVLHFEWSERMVLVKICFFCGIFQWWAGIHGDRAAILSCVVSAIVSLLAWTKITGFLDSWVVRLNKCKSVCVYMWVNVFLWVYSYVRVRKMSVVINVSVNVSDGVCNKLDNRDGYKCWKNTLFLTDIYY